MKTNNYQEKEIEDIVLSCNHSKASVKIAVESYIVEHDRMFGEFSTGELKNSVVLDNQYDEETGEFINSDWQTTITVTVIDNVINVTFS